MRNGSAYFAFNQSIALVTWCVRRVAAGNLRERRAFGSEQRAVEQLARLLLERHFGLLGTFEQGQHPRE